MGSRSASDGLTRLTRPRCKLFAIARQLARCMRTSSLAVTSPDALIECVSRRAGQHLTDRHWRSFSCDSSRKSIEWPDSLPDRVGQQGHRWRCLAMCPLIPKSTHLLHCALLRNRPREPALRSSPARIVPRRTRCELAANCKTLRQAIALTSLIETRRRCDDCGCERLCQLVGETIMTLETCAADTNQSYGSHLCLQSISYALIVRHQIAPALGQSQRRPLSNGYSELELRPARLSGSS